MGYILPIAHDDYKNYQYRMPKQNLGLHDVKQSYKVIQAEYNHHIRHQNHLPNKHFKHRSIKSKSAVESQVAQITGKGVFFNREA